MSNLERTLVIGLRPSGESFLVEGPRPYRDLIRWVQEVPGSQAVVAFSTRPPLRGRDPRWGEWQILAYAETEASPVRQLELIECLAG